MEEKRTEKTVFLSYRRTDIHFARNVYHDLTEKQFDVFWDIKGIGPGDFDRKIAANIKSRAHFVLVLTPTALERCKEPEDPLRREIETALDHKRNIIPVLFDGVRMDGRKTAAQLTGKLASLRNYNAVEVPRDYFEAAMLRLRTDFLNVEISTVLHPASLEGQLAAVEQTVAAIDETVAEDGTQTTREEGKKLQAPGEMPQPVYANALESQATAVKKQNEGAGASAETQLKTQKESFIEIPLVGELGLLHGQSPDPRLFDASARWILAVEVPLAESGLQIRLPNLVKVCSERFVAELVKRALPGLPLTPIAAPSPTLLPKGKFQYFAIAREGPCWEHILETHTVGVYAPRDIAGAQIRLLVEVGTKDKTAPAPLSIGRFEKSVFLAYRRTSAYWAQAMYQNLTRQGFDVFFDYQNIASEDFEKVILGNIAARAHFVVLLTPRSLERGQEPGDWFRREIETALEKKRNVVPLLLGGFNIATAEMAGELTGTLRLLKNYNGLEVLPAYLDLAMERLGAMYLNVKVSRIVQS